MIVQGLSKKGLLFSAIFLFFALFFICLEDNSAKKDENIQVTVLRTVSECTFVNELISVGFSENEAIQNVNSCKDRVCPFHHPKSYPSIALIK